ncbi:MAG TPA: VapE domain-containing protein [Roseiarcus sp.]|nr:VapE domain-containing protein [Roseiarcus sp.]
MEAVELLPVRLEDERALAPVAAPGDISSAVESYRRLWSQDLYERPHGFCSIGTTNKDQYNYDTINRRYYGMKVAVDGKMLDKRSVANYDRILGSLVWNVKNGMSGAISKEIASEARYHQDIRVVENDLKRRSGGHLVDGQ